MVNDSTVQFDPLTFNADLSNVSLVEEQIDNVCAQVGLDEDLYGNVLIAVTEAVNNAILHGAPKSQDQKVRFGISLNEREIHFSVSDSGPGFDYRNLPDPTAPENLEKEFGRGVFLMRSLADEVQYNESGNAVDIVFFR